MTAPQRFSQTLLTKQARLRWAKSKASVRL